jgi:hypothetical protein
MFITAGSGSQGWVYTGDFICDSIATDTISRPISLSVTIAHTATPLGKRLGINRYCSNQRERNS